MTRAFRLQSENQLHAMQQRIRGAQQAKAAPAKDEPLQFVVKLPWAPAVNHSHELNANGSRRLSDAAQAFREQASSLAREYFRAHGHKTLTGDVRVSLLLVPPDKRKRDIDGPIKQILDALQAAEIFRDDCQVKQLEVTMLDCMFPGQGSTVATIKTL
jgi:crossover junction endodeoxyribonuclease RusA